MNQPVAYTALKNKSAELEKGSALFAHQNGAMRNENVATLILVDINSASKLWGYSRFVIGRFALRNVPGLNFFKVLGSGYEGGFGLKPSDSRQGLFCVFANDAQANWFLNESPLAKAYQNHSREYLSVKLHPFSVKGSWAGTKLDVTTEARVDFPIAALTRASIRPTKAKTFWAKAPPAEVSLEKSKGCILASGVGEAPFLRQATFSVWDSVAAMDAYARTGAHMEAIKASMSGDYFSESMFVRFVPEQLQGVYKGKSYSL